jgi:hypothetical protein
MGKAAGSGGSGPGSGGGGNGGGGTGTGGRTVAHIGRPRDGKFDMVVIGSAAADDYPEAMNIWHGRLAYTVYLQVGAVQKWILQYAIVNTQEVASAAGPGHIEAPWPYDISRPSVDDEANADAILVHGFVNEEGRFEKLGVVFPTELAEASFLIHALQAWQFRPATWNGKPTSVEVLLIIPGATE